MPDDPSDVVRLFAVATRAACEQPAAAGRISERLLAATRGLLPPEVFLAAECRRQWAFFARRLAGRRDVAVRRDVGERFLQEIERLGQRFDVAPLPMWEELPLTCDAAPSIRAPVAAASSFPPGGAAALDTLEALRQAARGVVNFDAAYARAQSATGLARLIAVASAATREELLAGVIDSGVLARTEAMLLHRWLVKGGNVGSQDTVLVETLQKVGRWLV